MVLQPYGSMTEFAVPSLNTMAPHDGVGMTCESGYFVGPANPLISNVIVDAMRGAGLRTFIAGENGVSLLDWRHLAMAPAGGASGPAPG